MDKGKHFSIQKRGCAEEWRTVASFDVKEHAVKYFEKLLDHQGDLFEIRLVSGDKVLKQGGDANYMSENAKVTLTLGQLASIVRESGVSVFEDFVRDGVPPEALWTLVVPDGVGQEDESVRGAITLSLIAGLLSVGSILRANEITARAEGVSSPNQIQNVIDSAGKREFGGYSAAQATNILMRTIYQEAKGESPLGRRMVATVIWNRAGGNADKMPGVCLRKSQFSVWNALSGRTPSTFKTKVPSGVLTAGRKQAVWNEVKGLVEQMLDGTFTPEGDYNAYMNKDTADSKAVNGWGKSMTGQKLVGHHTFGYLPEYDGFGKGKAVKYDTTYKVKKGDLGVSYIARDLIKANRTSYSDVKALTDKIIEINSFKTDKRGNPIIKVGDVIKLPA